MALKNYVAKRETIPVGDEPVSIRGLRVSDISVLLEAHKAELFMVYELYNGAGDAPTEESRNSRVLVEMTRVLPDLVAAIIALAADEPDAVEQAKSLPFPTQIDALSKIAKMTFEEVGGLGNFFAVLSSLAAGIGVSPRGMQKSPPASPALQ